jgi:hypothetical protein
VAVRVHRRHDVLVAEPELDLQRVGAVLDQPGRARVAEVVEAERAAGEGVSDCGFEDAPVEVAVADWLAGRRREDERLRAGPAGPGSGEVR